MSRRVTGVGAEAEPFAPRKGDSRAPVCFWLEYSHSGLQRGRERGSDFAPPAALIAPTAGTLGLTENVTPPAPFGVPSEGSAPSESTTELQRKVRCTSHQTCRSTAPIRG